MLLKQPAMSGDQPRCRFELRRGRVISTDPLSKTSHSKEVVAYCAASLAEVVRDARLNVLRGVCGKQRPHADGQLIFPPELKWIGLIPKVACVYNAGQPNAVGVSVQLGCAAEFVRRRLHGLKCGESCRSRGDNAGG